MPDDRVIFAPPGSRAAIELGSSQLTVEGETEPCPEMGCGIDWLDGSWLLQLDFPFNQIRGPMRIEAGEHVLRLSGDMYREYVDHLKKPGKQIGGSVPIAVVSDPTIRWYPSFPQDEYVWYFVSDGASYVGGRLTAYIEKYPWRSATQDFGPPESGTLKMRCISQAVTKILPGGHKVSLTEPLLTMTGCLELADTVIPVRATRTSPHYRGCKMEVDVMIGRSWPVFGNSCDNPPIAESVRNIFLKAGMDVDVTISQQNLPVDASMTQADLFNYMATYRDLQFGSSDWRLWMLIGSSSQGNPGTYGIMFDSDAAPPHRTGAVGFFDPVLSAPPSLQAGADGQSIGNVRLAFIRTITHEAGHAFNLLHPNQDVHNGTSSETIMNQTGAVRSFSTPGNPFACNADMFFDSHNTLSLIHSPDPQVKPGWLAFGWGHFNGGTTLPSPSDAAGGSARRRTDEDIVLALSLPDLWAVGDVPIARLTLQNIGAEPRTVVGALELSGGALEIEIVGPDGRGTPARSVAIACGDHPMVELAPGESITRSIQLFYGADGLRFTQPGHYRVRAQLDLDPRASIVARSEVISCFVASPSTEEERALARMTVDDRFGQQLALADIGVDDDTRARFEAVANEHPNSQAGAAAGIVLANSYGGRLRDLRAGEVIRRSSKRNGEAALERVIEHHGMWRAAELAVAIAGIDGTEAAAVLMCGKRLRGTQSKSERDGGSEGLNLIEDLRRTTHGDHRPKSD